MEWIVGVRSRITIDGVELEAQCWGPSPSEAPTIILLHEGLGSVGLWRDFPERLDERTGYGVFAYSRAGYGNSDPVSLPRPLDYMSREAMDILPKVLEQIGFERGLLIGHSDGASITAIYAGGIVDFRVRGIVLIAPHFFAEAEGLDAIAKAKVTYATTDLKDRLTRHHADPDIAFNGWSGAWSDPGFKAWNIEDAIRYIRVPVLAIQGRDDAYGTLAQIAALETGLTAPFEQCILDVCGHAPQFEKSEETMSSICEFLIRLERIEAA